MTPVEGYLDLGALSLPLVAGMQLKPVITQNGCESITVLMQNWQVNLAVIAAPKSGQWWEKYAEKMLAEGGEKYRVITTAHGPELLTEVEALPMRITGIDGAGWMLRVIYIGRIVHDQQARQNLAPWLDQVSVQRPDGVYLPGEIIALNLDKMQAMVSESEKQTGE